MVVFSLARVRMIEIKETILMNADHKSKRSKKTQETECNDDQVFDALIQTCNSLILGRENDVVFIGGIATYLYTKYVTTWSLAESTHDADIYVSGSTLAEIKEEENLVQNKRLSKHQISKKGFEFDIYSEYASNLAVPFSEIMARSVKIQQYTVASLSDLLVLKLAAYVDRKSSDKGRKDARDIIKILSVMGDDSPFLATIQPSVDPVVITKYLSSEDVEMIESIVKNKSMMADIGEHQQLKVLKKFVDVAMLEIKKCLEPEETPCVGRKRKP